MYPHETSLYFGLLLQSANAYKKAPLTLALSIYPNKFNKVPNKQLQRLLHNASSKMQGKRSSWRGWRPLFIRSAPDYLITTYLFAQRIGAGNCVADNMRTINWRTWPHVCRDIDDGLLLSQQTYVCLV